MSDLNSAILSTQSAAGYLGVSARYLEKLRTTGGGPQFVKLGRRVLYRRSDLEVFLEERAVRSTSEVGHIDARARDFDR